MQPSKAQKGHQGSISVPSWEMSARPTLQIKGFRVGTGDAHRRGMNTNTNNAEKIDGLAMFVIDGIEVLAETAARERRGIAQIPGTILEDSATLQAHIVNAAVELGHRGRRELADVPTTPKQGGQSGYVRGVPRSKASTDLADVMERLGIDDLKAGLNAPQQACLTDLFGPVISEYTRAQAVEDGVLVDVTEWASAKTGFHGGFTCPVAITQALWGAVDVPKGSRRSGDTRGRAHDVLWLASLAARRTSDDGSNAVGFRVRLGAKNHRLRLVVSGGDAGEMVMTIGYPDDF